MRRLERFDMRHSDAEMDAWRVAAQASGRSVASWLRGLANAACGLVVEDTRQVNEANRRGLS